MRSPTSSGRLRPHAWVSDFLGGSRSPLVGPQAVTILLVAVFSSAMLQAAEPGLGRVALVGDSITQGGPTPSYRYPFWKALVDAGLEHGRDYTFVGSQSGFYAGGKQAAAPDHDGEKFPNVHEGHWGWRAAWLAGAAPLPKGRHAAKNLGGGTVATWTGRSRTYVTADTGTVTYAGPVAVPETVVLMIGINDLADGIPAAQVAGHIRTIVGLYQAANANVHVHVCSVLPVAAKHAKAATINPQVAALDDLLARQARTWSTKTSPVDFVDLRPGFDAARMTYDSTHPNAEGEVVIAASLARALRIGAARGGTMPDAAAGRPIPRHALRSGPPGDALPPEPGRMPIAQRPPPGTNGG